MKKITPDNDLNTFLQANTLSEEAFPEKQRPSEKESSAKENENG